MELRTLPSRLAGRSDWDEDEPLMGAQRELSSPQPDERDDDELATAVVESTSGRELGLALGSSEVSFGAEEPSWPSSESTPSDSEMEREIQSEIQRSFGTANTEGVSAYLQGKRPSSARRRSESPVGASGSSRSPKTRRSARLSARSETSDGEDWAVRWPVHERLYARGTEAQHSRAASREAEKLARNRWLSPKVLKDYGPAAEACRRLHEGVQSRQEQLARTRLKYEKAFAAAAPFSPNRSGEGAEGGPLSPRRGFKAWVQEQELWKRQRDERRDERAKNLEMMEADYAERHSVHRDCTADPDRVVARLCFFGRKSKEKLQKMRTEKLEMEKQEIEEKSVHRDVQLDAAKVQQSVRRLYHEDLEKRDARLRTLLAEKMKAELEEEAEVWRSSVHSIALERRLRLASPNSQSQEIQSGDPSNRTSGLHRETPKDLSPRAGNANSTENKPACEQTSEQPHDMDERAQARRHVLQQGHNPNSSTREEASEQPHDMDERARADAAVRIQRVQRGRQARRHVLQQGHNPNSSTREEASEQPHDMDERARADAAVRIQRVQRGRQARRHVLQQGHSPNSSTREEASEQPHDMDERARADAAVRIQSVQRGRQARRHLLQQGHSPSSSTREEASEQPHDMDERARADAAVRIQSVQRGRQARRHLLQQGHSPTREEASEKPHDMDERARADAAVRIQSVQRGRQARRHLLQQGHSPSSSTREEASEQPHDMDEIARADAAVRIQSVQRGRQARRHLLQQGHSPSSSTREEASEQPHNMDESAEG
ncbi:unnamed protein product [Symbiodinium sp. CCMP2592]|nr:unnamed protein product [Symbiodinium sp. CCMP2592]